MIIECTLSSNVPEWLNEMKETIENIFGVKFEDKKECSCNGNCCCHKKNDFSDVKEIEHID